MPMTKPMPMGHAWPLFVVLDEKDQLHIVAKNPNQPEVFDITNELADQFRRMATRAVKLEVTWENLNAST